MNSINSYLSGKPSRQYTIWLNNFITSNIDRIKGNIYSALNSKELYLSAIYKVSKLLIDIKEKNNWIEKQNHSLAVRMLNKQISTSKKAKALLEKHDKNVRIYKLNFQQCKLLVNQGNTLREDNIVKKTVFTIVNQQNANAIEKTSAADKIYQTIQKLNQNLNILENFYSVREKILQEYIAFFDIVEHFQKNLEFVQTIYSDKLPDDRLKAIRAMEKLATARLKTSKNLQNTLDKGRVLLKTLRQTKTNILAMQTLDPEIKLKKLSGSGSGSDQEKENSLDNDQTPSIEYVQTMLDTLGKYPGQLERVWMEKEIRVDLWCSYGFGL